MAGGLAQSRLFGARLGHSAGNQAYGPVSPLRQNLGPIFSAPPLRTEYRLTCSDNSTFSKKRNTVTSPYLSMNLHVRLLLTFILPTANFFFPKITGKIMADMYSYRMTITQNHNLHKKKKKTTLTKDGRRR